MTSLLDTQNERNRELTRLWSSGEVGDEELGRIFMENRTAHRAEIRALVGEGGLPRYQKFLKEGGLGGLFSYFTAPGENWAESDPQR